MATLWTLLKNIPVEIKCAVATLWATFGEIGLLFILPSGHTDHLLPWMLVVLLNVHYLQGICTAKFIETTDQWIGHKQA